MANLETLELTINANAESARTGIDNLITSLSSLSDALTKPYSDLRDFNAELKKMKEYCQGFKMPNLSKMTGAMSAVSRAKKTKVDYDEAANNNRLAISTAKREAENITYAQKYLTDAEKFNAGWERKAELAARRQELEAAGFPHMSKDALQQMNGTKVAAESVTNAVKDTTTALKENGTAISETTKDAEETESTFSKLKAGFKSFASGLTGIFSKIKRIATTMLIRSTIRNLIKDIKEGITNVREWAKVNNHEFYKSMDGLKQKTNQLKNALGASFVPLIQALIPVLKSLSSAIIEVANWFNQLISLLTGKSTWIQAQEDIEGYTDDVNNANNATKEWLASFDELNVMSKASGGNGGGNQPDYEDMFQEIGIFDERIREIADFLRNNFETLKVLAIDVGAAILAWKLGNTFAESLPLLSTIFGYIATGATIALTVALDWLLMDEYLDTKNEGWFWAGVLETAIGSTAAWAIAKKLIGGQAGTYAAGITLLLTAAADIAVNVAHTDVSALSKESLLVNAKAAIESAAGIGLIANASGASLVGTLTAAGGAALIAFGVATGLKVITDKTNTQWDSKETIVGAVTAAIPVGLGLFVLGVGGIPAGIAALATFGVVIAVKAMMPENKITYGDIHLSEEEIQKLVSDEMFTVNVKVAVNAIHDSVSVTQAEKLTIATSLANALGTFKLIRLGIASTQDYTQMHEDVDTLLTNIQTYIKDVKNQSKLTIQYTPTLAGGTEIEQGTWFTSYNQGWDKIQSFVEGKGAIIGQWLTEQESKEIKDAVPDVVAAAMEQLTAVTNAIAQAQIGAEAFGNFQLSLGDLDEASLTDTITKFKAYKAELTSAYEELVKEQYQHQAELVEALKITLGDDYENDPEYQAQLTKLHEMGANMSNAVKDGVESASEPGTSLIKEWLDGQLAGTVEYGEDYWYDLFENQGLTGADLQGILRNVMEQNLDQEQIEIADLVGFTGWDLLSDEMKHGLIGSFDILKPENLTYLKDANIPIDDIIKFSGWENMESEQQDEFINSLKEVFGSDEALAAAKKAGMDVGKYVTEGYQENTDVSTEAEVTYNESEVKQAGTNITNVFKSTANGTVTGKLSYNSSTVKDTSKKFNALIHDNANGTVTGKLTYTTSKIKEKAKAMQKVAKKYGTPEINPDLELKNSEAKAFKKDVNKNVVPDVATDLYTTKQEMGAVENQIESGVNPSVDIEIAVTNLASWVEQLKKKIKAMLDGLGWFNFGSNGRSISVSTSSSKSVTSIASGSVTLNSDNIMRNIAESNDEQNALLRRQNELLYSILQKSSNVTISASSALGRVVNQSLAMYGNMTGV